MLLCLVNLTWTIFFITPMRNPSRISSRNCNKQNRVSWLYPTSQTSSPSPLTPSCFSLHPPLFSFSLSLSFSLFSLPNYSVHMTCHVCNERSLVVNYQHLRNTNIYLRVAVPREASRHNEYHILLIIALWLHSMQARSHAKHNCAVPEDTKVKVRYLKFKCTKAVINWMLLSPCLKRTNFFVCFSFFILIICLSFLFTIYVRIVISRYTQI